VSALDYRDLLATADRAARSGGDVVRRYFGRPEEVRAKSPGDWVSEADVASEKAIRELLVRESGLPVYGEEAGGDEFDTGWLVDPLDGTSNFLHGFDAVGVSVGMIADGEPVVGVVHAPLLNRTYYGAQGVGAFRDDKPMRVSNRPGEQAIVSTGFPFRHRDLLPRYEHALAAALRGFEDLRRVGAASLDLCWTAEGVFDGYFELRLGPWDVAAGGVIVREAGGVVSDWAGNDRAWLLSGNILAGPPAVHSELLRIAAASRGD
jgi:myo-inositol-1(or 4)-monophosphatase